MLVTKDTTSERTVKSDMGFLTWSSSDKGKIDETVIHTLIDAGGTLSITTPEGVVVEFKESTGDVRKDAELLSNVEGLEWMGDLLQRDDVDWVAVQEIHDQWSKSDGGLAPGAMVIIAIIASAVTAGAASSLAMATMGLHIGANGVLLTATGTVATSVQMAMCSAITAAITSVSAQVATSLADAAAGGDIGKNLGNIVSIEGLRSLVATMILAGTLDTFGGDFAELGKPGEIMAITTVKTTTSTLVGGEALEDAFVTALGSTFASHAKGLITDKQLNETVELILAGSTGAAGAAGAAIAGGDPMQGAMSAIVARLAGKFAAPELTEKMKKEDGPKARLANCGYDDDCQGVDGYDRMSNTALLAKGVNPELLVNENSGLYTEVFYNKERNEVVIVYRGTEMTHGNDWVSNIVQGLGNVGGQYNQLQAQLQSLRDMATGLHAQLVATGHSLGGGLATAIASTGYVDKAVVFNPAGVHPNTVVAVGGTVERMNTITTSYTSRADLLTNLQDMLSFIMPTASGTRVLVDGAGLHGMAAVLKVFDTP